MKYNYLYQTSLELYQPEDHYHFNSDSEFLGRSLWIKEKQRVLDIGTNNGYLLLWASLYTDMLYGIDLYEELIENAKSNFVHNHIYANLSVSSLQNYQEEPFDVLICNPPYFHNHLQNVENKFLHAARHTSFLSPQELFFHSSRLLKDTGTLQLVQRVENIHIFDTYALQNNLYPLYSHTAMTKPNGKPISMVKFYSKNKNAVQIVEDDAYLNNRETLTRRVVL